MKKKTFNFKIQNRKFFRRNIKKVLLLKIIDNSKKQNEIIKYMHNEKKRFVKLSINIIEKTCTKNSNIRQNLRTLSI